MLNTHVLETLERTCRYLAAGRCEAQCKAAEKLDYRRKHNETEPTPLSPRPPDQWEENDGPPFRQPNYGP